MKIQNYQNKKSTGQLGKLCTLNFKLLTKGGFTLVELMVTITVFVAVTLVVLVNQSDFNGGVILNNLAYDVALSTRQAQSYGINVRGKTTDVLATSQVIFPPYGVAFDLARNKEFVFFADTYPAANESTKIGNGLYDAGVAEVCTGNALSLCAEFIEKYRIQRGNFIKQLCVTRASGIGGDEECANAGESGTLTISFRRPNPDAIINSSIGAGSAKIISARIVLGAPEGNERSVLVYESGQISVQE